MIPVITYPSSITSFEEWLDYFQSNRGHFDEIEWIGGQLSEEESKRIGSSIQQFQRGEASDGNRLRMFAHRQDWAGYEDCIALFIKEEQQHAVALARFMRRNNIHTLKHHWVDRAFRTVRRMKSSRYTVPVLLVAEIIALGYYRALKESTRSGTLRAICSQILKDETMHVRFQCYTLNRMYSERTNMRKRALIGLFHFIRICTVPVVWYYHKEVLQYEFASYRAYRRFVKGHASLARSSIMAGEG